MDVCYSIGAYKRAYEPIINPTNGPNNWPKSKKPELQAPTKINLPGFPKGKRRAELGEKGYIATEGGVQRINRAGLSQYKCKNYGKNRP